MHRHNIFPQKVAILITQSLGDLKNCKDQSYTSHKTEFDQDDKKADWC